ncbi:MAG: hypothetical protein HDR88_17725 [Bacteroides sp.]|nr:hypothetical protein [Bacteroides sp.]
MKNFTKRISGILILGVIASIASGSNPQRVQLSTLKEADLRNNPNVTVAPERMTAPAHDIQMTRTPQKVKRDASGMTWTILIDEDFSKLTEGSVQDPSEERLCYYYGEPGMYIDPQYTQQAGWTGSNAFSAGGAIFMKEVNASTGAPLNTPLGDYSGNLTISFRYRIAPGYDKHSQVIVDILKGGIDHPQVADCDFNFYACNVYPGQEDWKYAEVTCKNLSADNDGFIQFNCYGAVILDDIEIKSANDFIASPVLKPITDFTQTSFTANWEPVRLASYYYVELSKKVYTSDETSIVYNEDFENITAVPEGWTINNFSEERISDAGNNNSKGLIMNNGDYVETPDNMAKYKWFKMFGRLVTPENFDIYSITGTVTFSLRTEDGWTKLSSAPAGWFYDPWYFDFGAELYPGFNENYYGLKIEVDGLAEGTYIVFDDFEFETGRPSKLEPIITLNNYVAIRDGSTSYTFTDLDPESEYYYGIYAFYQGIYSQPATEHAFGVAAPELLPASEIKSDSYVANWMTAPKATGYILTNYGVYEAEEDVVEATILEEDFSKITSDLTWATSFNDAEPLDNYTKTSLDAYTTLPGWTGIGNMIFTNALGVIDSMNTLYYIQTPPLTLDNDDYFVLSLQGQVAYDDVLVVWVNSKAYRLPVYADEFGGEFSGEFEISEAGHHMPIMFYTANGSPFCLEFVGVYQNMKKGQKIYTYLSEQTLDSSTTSTPVDGLNDDFSKYAYEVKSVFQYEGQTTYSDSYEKIIVDLKNGTSNSGVTGINEISEIDGETIWYSIDGRRLSQPERGICIAKYPDGSTKKVIVR